MRKKKNLFIYAQTTHTLAANNGSLCVHFKSKFEKNGYWKLLVCFSRVFVVVVRFVGFRKKKCKMSASCSL